MDSQCSAGVDNEMAKVARIFCRAFVYVVVDFFIHEGEKAASGNGKATWL